MSESPDELTPPAWAESLLRLLLRPEDRESVSGDLLEQYRDSVRPTRGAFGADLWYVRQLAGFLWRVSWFWGVLLGAAVVTRTALDWFVPPETFYTRATVTTYTAVTLFLAAGFWTVWRSRSLGAAMLAGIGAGVISAAITIVSTVVMISIWHDPQTRWAIAHSGGLEEEFTLPMMVIVVGAVIATVGGVVGKGVRFLFRSHAVE